jgi:hypothetical protein
MRMAYLIMAHHDRAGLARLAKVLLPDGAPDRIVIHADARSALWRDLRHSPLSDDPRIHVLPDPVPVIWGHWSQVEGARRLMAAALSLGCDHAHLLSGVDWPVVSRERIIADIAAQPMGTCFIEAEPLIQQDRMQGFRFDTRWLRLDPTRDKIAYAATWELRRLARLGGYLREKLRTERSRPLGPWHKGSCWWSLPTAAMASSERDLRDLVTSRRLSGTVCADEHAMATAIACRFATLIQPNRRFIDFPPGLSSPRVLTRDDLPAIRQSGAWFMRKVDATIDPFFYQMP